MILVIHPGSPLRGEVTLPGDKSISHRAALLASLAEGRSRIQNFLVAGVTEVMLAALEHLGVAWRLEDHAGKLASLTVDGAGWAAMQAPEGVLDCGHSGTTMRFLAGMLAGAGLPAVLDGSVGLRRRPMNRVVVPLQQMGAPVEASPAGTAPLRFSARPRQRPLRPLDYDLPVASAQVKTALLLAALEADGPTTLREPGPSRDHTEHMLAGMGVTLVVEEAHGGGQGRTITLKPPGRPLQPLTVHVPGDWSSASFLIAAAAITPGSEIVIRGVGLNPTRTGFLDALRAMGADLEILAETETTGERQGDLIIRHRALQPVDIDGPLVVRMIDEFPAFGSVAAYAAGRSTVREAAELRLKESDRIRSLCQGLAALGVSVEERPDGLVISGGDRLQGGRVKAWGDHRLGMALTVAALAARQPVEVHGAEMIAQSYPEFVPALQSLGAVVETLEEA